MNPTLDRTRLGRVRDNLLKHVATDWYRAMIGGSIRLGLQSAKEDKR